mgnify:FL=1
MSLTIIDHSGQMNEELKRFTERRVRFALSRFDDRILGIEVVISEEITPLAGDQKVCRVCVTLRRASDVEVTDRDNDLATCISRVAQRAGRAVMRVVQLAQHPQGEYRQGIDHDPESVQRPQL